MMKSLVALICSVVLTVTIGGGYAKDRKWKSDAESDIEAAKTLPDRPPEPSKPDRSYCLTISERTRALFETSADEAAWRDLCALLGNSDAANEVFRGMKANAKRLRRAP